MKPSGLIGVASIYRRVRNRYFVVEPLVYHTTGARTGSGRRVRIEHEAMQNEGLVQVKALIEWAALQPRSAGLPVTDAELEFLREHELVHAELLSAGTLELCPMLRRGKGRFRGADITIVVARNATSKTFYRKLLAAFEEAT